MQTDAQEIRHCAQCGLQLSQREDESHYYFRKRLFCDKTCANRHKNDQVRGKPNPRLAGVNNGMWGKTHTVAARMKQSEAARAHPLTAEQQQQASTSRTGLKRSSATRARMSKSRLAYWENMSPAERARRREQFLQRMPMRPRFRRTNIERMIAQELDANDIQYEWNAPLLGRFCVDFLLRDYPIVIECDGEYWHSLPETQKRDEAKNVAVVAAGYTLFRFSEREIRHDAKACIERVVNVLH